MTAPATPPPLLEWATFYGFFGLRKPGTEKPQYYAGILLAPDEEVGRLIDTVLASHKDTGLPLATARFGRRGNLWIGIFEAEAICRVVREPWDLHGFFRSTGLSMPQKLTLGGQEYEAFEWGPG